MNSKDHIEEDSRRSEASTSSNLIPQNPPVLIEERDRTLRCNQDVMKRSAAVQVKQMIERYFYQLIDGCGNPNCDNKHCASSGEARSLTPNEAAAEAIKLFHSEAKLCDVLPNKVPKTDHNVTLSRSTDADASTSKAIKSIVEEQIDHIKNTHKNDNGSPLTEELMYELCDKCHASNKPAPLATALKKAFTDPYLLAKSFQKKILAENNNVDKRKNNSKESEGLCSSTDPDKDVDSVTGPGLDVASCQRAFKYLYKVPLEFYNSTLNLAMLKLAEKLESDLKKAHHLSIDEVVNCFLIIFQVPDLGGTDYIETTLPRLCLAAENICIKGQAKLVRALAAHSKGTLQVMLDNLHQLITLRIMTTNYSSRYHIHNDQAVTSATKMMKIVYYANILAGDVESNQPREELVELANVTNPMFGLDLYPEFMAYKSRKPEITEDPLAIELNLDVLDCRKPYLPFEDFYNEPLSDYIEMDKEFSNYKLEMEFMDDSSLLSRQRFSFLRHPFILTAACKSVGLHYESRVRMLSERRAALLHAVLAAAPPQPYLRLRVRRDHIVRDALLELEMIAMEQALDLKKQLVVEFEGEQGIDEGGVSKEFFQLIVEEIFNPDYGMFTHQPDTNTVWFNPTSFESDAQFTLIGIVLGLAIYNNIILAVNFPMVVYRKLMGRKGSFEDLAEWNPTLYNGLKDLLEYSGEDLEEVYYQTFRICYQDMFGTNLFEDLKENGDNIFVTQENKKEFVSLYADFLLNKSVATQFLAFRRGFAMVTDESPLAAFFRPEEVEVLVCGSRNFDFNELEHSTEYDGGYTPKTQIIRDFWTIVHGLSLDDKRKLLQFTTGSDRVPVGGLSRLKLIIARNGPDSDRLPTAHTCFNVLLLPEYSSREKLEDRLMKAFSYAQGFGML